METFKGGQDFEYVKYVVSKQLGVSQEDIDIFNDGKKVIPLLSICDIEIKDNCLGFTVKKSD